MAQQNNRPKQLVPGAKPAETTTEQAVESGGVQVNRLNAPGRAAAGLLTEDQGGLSATLWQGSSRDVLQHLFNRLPGGFASPAARSVARGLLLSTGAFPPGNVSDQQMLALRLNALLRLGDAESVVALAEAAGGLSSDAAVSRPLTDALFLLNENLRACAVVQAQVRAGGGVDWQQASVFCDLLTENEEAAELTLSLLSETGDADKAFTGLVDAMRDKSRASVAGSADTSALHVAMMRLAGSAAVSKIGDLQPHIARALASLPGLPAEQRVQAGGVAVRQAGLAASVVALLLGDQAVTANQEPLRNAVLEVVNAGSPALQAEALNDLWQKAGESGDRLAAAAYAADTLGTLSQQAGVGFMAAAAMRMALLNDDLEQAQGWYDLLSRAAASGDQNLLNAQIEAQGLAQLAGLAPRNDQVLQTWLADGAGSRERQLLVLLLLDGLGQPARDALWSGLLESGAAEATSSDPALWRQMIMAAGGARSGESVLAALAIAGAEGPEGLDARTLSMIVGTLRRAGLQAQARRLAIEALILNGG